jgi:hypothetical protein
MKQIYKIDIKHQLRSFRQSLLYVYVSVFGVGFTYFMFHNEFNWWTIFLVGPSLLWFAVLITAPLHIQYLTENWNTKLWIDNERQMVTIEDKSGSFSYSVQDLKTERYVGAQHKPGMIKSGKPIPFDYYGYVKIRTKDRKVFYITSLMTDPFDFPLPISEAKYGLTFINKTDLTIADKRKQIEFTKNQKIEEYIERFSKLSNDTLHEKVNNSKRYEIEAVRAAEYVLSERQKVATANTKL